LKIFLGLAKLVESELLEGENAYFCEQCNKKVDTIKRVRIKELPNHLLFVLKRFEFDFDTFQKVKINDFYEFPPKLNMRSYTIDNNNQQDSYFEYFLSGVIIHMGIADAGHYYSLVSDRYNQDGRWIEFNDTNAKFFDLTSCATEAFGYDERLNNGNCVNRFKNAYILIYDRTGVQRNSEIDDIFKTSEIFVDKERKDLIKEDNRQLVLNKILFNKEFFSLFDCILEKGGDADINNEYQMKKIHCAIDYFLFVIARTFEKNALISNIFPNIKTFLDKVFLNLNFSSKIFIKEC
jgi:ubiquitin carboxyl-terminal hydrolase 9/24